MSRASISHASPHPIGGRVALAGALLAFAAFTLACAHPGAESPFDSHQEGLASFYSSKLAGRATASGEIYDPEALTAAHRTLPLGTWVRVERIDGGGEDGAAVDVRINDRGPFVGERIIDLSDAAARALDMKHEGVVPVRVRLLSVP